MLYFFIIVLTQGIGELLPISSSAHIFLVSHFLHFPAIANDLSIALHLGSLLAILCYFYKTLWKIIAGTCVGILRFRKTPGLIMALTILLASLPAIVVGYGVKRYLHIPPTFLVSGAAFVGFGILAAVAEIRNKNNVSKITLGKGMLIGFMQMFAFIPGASRLGLCTTMTSFLNLTRWQGISFSFIMAIPILLGAVVLSLYDKMHTSGFMWTSFKDIYPMILGTFGVSLAFFPLLKWYANRFSLAPFGIYRVIMGLFLLYLSYKTHFVF